MYKRFSDVAACREPALEKTAKTYIPGFAAPDCEQLVNNLKISCENKREDYRA